MRVAVALVACLSLGCAQQLGECNPLEAEAVAYDRATGLPAYEGQALMIATCGGGRFCHAVGADVDRMGVPAGLDFDVRLAAPDGTVDEAAIARLRRSRFRVVQEAELILHAVRVGAMPPEDRTAPENPDAPPSWQTRSYLAVDDAGELQALPGPRDAAGREILRNWLACGAPTVERPLPRDDGVPSEVRPPLPVEPLEPTWQSIYEDLLVGRGCADFICHGGGDPDAGLVISSDSERMRVRLEEAEARASGEDCGGERLVVPGDPAASLLYRKLAHDGDVCGDPMPRGGFPLSEEDLAAVAGWIEGLELEE